MRVGRNSDKYHLPTKWERVTAAIVTYIPNKEGYFQDKLEIFKFSLESLVKNSKIPLNILVIDNNSCIEVVDELTRMNKNGKIDLLVLSNKNIGLNGAYKIIADIAPGEIIAYANDDIFYYEDWLLPQINLLEIFPSVGLVSGFYLKSKDPLLLEVAKKKELKIRKAKAPSEWLEEFTRDASYESADKFLADMKHAGVSTDQEDHIVICKDCEAYLGGVMWQAVFRKDTLKKLLPEGNPFEHGHRSYDAFFHRNILENGYLKLSTKDRLTRHIGNAVTDEFVLLAEKYNINTKSTLDSNVKWLRKLFRYRIIRGPLRRIANLIFKALNY
jgi:glycosyltransferase involved in cell wall biosynthesis